MGQQQLLLLVLATVIVGLATVAGIQAFDQGQTQANQDALTQSAVKIASDIQARIQEPAQFGGYDGSISNATSNITLEEMGYDTNSNVWETADGECAITTGGSNDASPSNGSQVDDGVTVGDIVVTCASPENDVSAHISSLRSEGIVTAQAVTAGS
jgi:hypothetical protein